MKRRNGINKFIIIVIVFLVILSKNAFSNSLAFLDKDISIIDNLEVYFFDVGQADSILVKQGDNTVLIDAGNNDDGKNIVNYLQELDLNSIDIVVGTHPHEDHIGGLDNVIESFEIGKIYMPDAVSTSKTFEEVLDVIEEKKYYIDVPDVDSKIELGDMIFEVLYTGSDEEDLNNSSIVLKLEFGNTSYLFTGDATSEIEKLLLNKDISADVLKVGHHGSKYSSSKAFLKKVSPKYAIIMVGNDNSYGHPTSETLNKLKKLNVDVYRTDRDGTIKITSDGNNINLEILNVSLDG